MAGRIYIGTAGWTIPKAAAGRFHSAGTHLERYGRVLSCAEINSSFYRPHKPGTYEKWAASTGGEFRFSVKVPKLITHELRLRRPRAPFERFLMEARGLGDRLGPLLVQLPPSLEFNPRTASSFFAMVRERHDAAVAFEPRHPTWFTPRANELLERYLIARVAADPAVTADAAAPGGWPGLAYFRLHGSPRMYWSRYDAGYIDALARKISLIARSTDVWCVFDNTAMGTAIENALELQELITG
jgi:uncharacterized protein YecE (DUF72 family)